MELSPPRFAPTRGRRAACLCLAVCLQLLQVPGRAMDAPVSAASPPLVPPKKSWDELTRASRTSHDSLQLAQRHRVLQPSTRPAEIPAPVVTALALQPGGSLLASAGDDHLVRLWDLRSEAEIHRLRGHSDWVRAVAFTHDGRWLVSAGTDGRVLIWDAQSGERKRQLAFPGQPIAALHSSPSQYTAVAGGFQCPIRLLNLHSGQVLFESSGPCVHLTDICMSPDGNLAAAGGRNGQIRVWELSGMTVVQSLPGHRGRVQALCFSPDSRWLITAGQDRRICVWDVENGQRVSNQPTRDGQVKCLVPIQAHLVAAGSTDNSVRLWDFVAGTEVARLTGHTGSVVALASDGNRVVSAGYDTTIRVWEVAQPSATTAEAPRQANLPETAR